MKRLFIATLLVAMWALGSSAQALAATLVVDDLVVDCPAPDYNSIQVAVTAANPGDTIEVCPGNYNESVTINEPLTLRGPNAGLSWDDGTRGSEAFVTSAGITFLITPGDGVTIDGFTISGSFGIYVQGSSDGTLIENNIITGGVRALTLDGTLETVPSNGVGVLNNHLVSNIRSLHVDGPYANMTVTGNRFFGAAASAGIFFTGGTPPNSINGFTFTDNEVLHPALMASNISNATVSGNTFNPALPGDESLLISLEHSVVRDNIFEGDDAIACLGLFGNEFGLVTASHHVIISRNIFSDCGTAPPSGNYAIQLRREVHHIDITFNQISNGLEGVNTEDTLPPWDVTDEIHINFNNITDNTSFGVRNGQLGVLDAECNWWGARNGPGPVGTGSGDNVSTNVDYIPWLTRPIEQGIRCAGRPDDDDGDEDECPDDDEDNDGLTNDRELLLLTLLGNQDSDFDGIKDGDDDANGNGEDDEDEDDGEDDCPNDSDGDGEDDEDEDDDDDDDD